MTIDGCPKECTGLAREVTSALFDALEINSELKGDKAWRLEEFSAAVKLQAPTDSKSTEDTSDFSGVNGITPLQ